jgi:phosphatidate phosphatase LPIN
MNPDRLLGALNREVVERKPHEFKIKCLESVKSIYPNDFNPFYAGFGNRPSDIASYTVKIVLFFFFFNFKKKAVGIDSNRIFIINPSGNMTTGNLTYKKTYTDLSKLCSEIFPFKKDHTVPEKFTDSNFWKDPIPDIDL